MTRKRARRARPNADRFGGDREPLGVEELENPPIVPARYLLQLWLGDDKVEAAVELPNVNSIQGTYIHAHDRAWTFDGLFEQFSGVRESVFVLQGRSGDQPSDIVRYAKLRNFVKKTSSLLAENKNAWLRDKDYRLVLNFPWEGYNFNATISTFTDSRVHGQTTNSYAYAITLRTNGWAVRKSSVGSRPTRKSYADTVEALKVDLPTTDADVADGLAGAVNKANKAKDGLSPTEDIPGTALSTDTDVLSVPPEIRETFERTTGMLSKAGSKESWYDIFINGQAGYVQAFREILNTPTQFLTNTRGAVMPFVTVFLDTMMMTREAVGSFYGEIEASRSFPAWIRDQLTQEYRRLLDTIRNPPWSRPRGYTPFAYDGQPVIPWVVPTGCDSCYDAAQDIFGDRSRWEDIADLNDMVTPYAFEVGVPLEPGDVILVPVPEGVAQKDGPLFGTDLRLVNGDLVFEGGDVLTVSGVDNYMQNLDHRLITKRGQNKAYPAFGLMASIQEKNIATLPAMFASDLNLQVQRDPRVSRITFFDLKDRGTTYEVRLEVELVTQARESLTQRIEVPA